MVTSIGVRLPAHLTATGRAMLALLSTEQLRAIYPASRPITTRTGPEPTTTTQLDEFLAETRSRGWAVGDGEVTLEYASVAAAVLDHKGYPAAAISLTFRGSIVDDAPWMKLGRATRNAAAAPTQRIRGKN